MADEPQPPIAAAPADLSELGVTYPSRAANTSLHVRPSATPHGPRSRTRSTTAADVVAPSSSSPQTSESGEHLDPVSSLHTSTPTKPEIMPVILETNPNPPSPGPGTIEEPGSQSPPQNPAVKTLRKLPALTPPPKISFESLPVRWKGLPLEAALWTFTSQELQNIVSRSIRSSASESFIRLLSLENLDQVLPAELERLDALKLTMQSKYKFLVHRRSMLLQAMNSHTSTPLTAKDAEDAMSIVGSLTVQLSKTVAECDEQVEELAKVYDQQAQISKILDVHWASALAIALRKLNSSYGKRTSDLKKARSRISQLEAELEDAWREAERLAREMDEYETAMNFYDEGEAVIAKAAIVSIPPSPAQRPQQMVPTYFTVESLSRTGSKVALTQSPSPEGQAFVQKLPESPSQTISTLTPIVLSREPSAPSSPSPNEAFLDTSADADAKASPANSVQRHENQSTPVVVVSDTASVRSKKSNKSTKSAKSIKSAKSSRLSIVSAARRRSYRTSEGSLRFHAHHKSAHARPQTPPSVPSVPPLPANTSKTSKFSTSLLSPKAFKTSKLFSATSTSAAPPVAGPRPISAGTSLSKRPQLGSTSSPARYDPQDPSTHSVVLDIRRRTSLEDLHIVDSPTAESFSLEDSNVTADDIYVLSRRRDAGGPEETARTPQHLSSDDLDLHSSANQKHPSNGIPSIWLQVDAPKTPAERVESLLQQGPKRNPYNKLKTLTKRYSLPFLLFNAKPSSPNQKAQRSA
ncbi:hypothetical protein AX17_002198 [Amanita inopinata Kibby_2008]|nr:hypothetical protein AX17_002198 [Amanita inopinata Kibby_2008]